jgi:hypothetical protein
VALGPTQRLTELSTRNLPSGKARSTRKADNLAAICEPIAWKLWEPWRLTTLLASTACYRDSLMTGHIRNTAFSVKYITCTLLFEAQGWYYEVQLAKLFWWSKTPLGSFAPFKSPLVGGLVLRTLSWLYSRRKNHVGLNLVTKAATQTPHHEYEEVSLRTSCFHTFCSKFQHNTGHLSGTVSYRYQHLSPWESVESPAWSFYSSSSFFELLD